MNELIGIMERIGRAVGVRLVGITYKRILGSGIESDASRISCTD